MPRSPVVSKRLYLTEARFGTEILPLHLDDIKTLLPSVSLSLMGLPSPHTLDLLLHKAVALTGSLYPEHILRPGRTNRNISSYVILLYTQPSNFSAPSGLDTPNVGVSVFNLGDYVQVSHSLRYHLIACPQTNCFYYTEQ